jgi:hypothetical protein
LVVVVFIHENEAFAIAVKVGHVALVNVRGFDFYTRVEGFVDHFARENVLELSSNECWAFAWLYVLKLDYGPKLTFDVKN